MAQSMEEELGVSSFVSDEGSRKRQTLVTEAGRIVYLHALEILQSEVALYDDLESLDKLRQGTLTLGIRPLGATFPGPAIAAFHGWQRSSSNFWGKSSGLKLRCGPVNLKLASSYPR
jgi:DNA-binding transcriptional LysR family regulator